MYEYKVLYVVTLLFITSTVAQLGLNEERDLMRSVNCNSNCQSRSRDPVCGTNGLTYGSICDLERDICGKGKVKLKHTGECSLSEKCRDERAFRQEQVSNGALVHVPTCLEDGTYARVQCHNFTFFCWCSSLDGQVIPHTIATDHKPQCSGDRTTAPPPDLPQQGKSQQSGIESVESRTTLLSLSVAKPPLIGVPRHPTTRQASFSSSASVRPPLCHHPPSFPPTHCSAKEKYPRPRYPPTIVGRFLG